MDNELMDLIVRLKVESKILRGLVDTILDSCRVNYDGSKLTIDNDAEIFAIIKAFYGDEYLNRLKVLKEE